MQKQSLSHTPKDQCKCGSIKCAKSKVCWECMTANYSEHNSKFQHGHNGASGKSPTYNSWDMMRQRCLNPKYTDYRNYGGRGIKVCERWSTFSNFLYDMGERPEGKTLDRKDNNGNYDPQNCRWSTRHEQRRNMRRNVWVEVDGERLIISDWAKKLGISGPGLRYRHKAGLWP